MVCAEPMSFYFYSLSIFDFNEQNRAPKDNELVSKWKENLGDDVIISGTICINHFDRKDIVPASTKRLARLKKGAVPMRPVNAVGPAFSDAIACASFDGSDLVEFLEIDDVKSHTDEECVNCAVLQAELKEVRGEYVKMEAKHSCELSCLNEKLNISKSTIKCQALETNLLKKRLDYAKSTKIKLQATLKDLKYENALCKEVIDFVQVKLKFTVANSV